MTSISLVMDEVIPVPCFIIISADTNFILINNEKLHIMYFIIIKLIAKVLNAVGLYTRWGEVMGQKGFDTLPLG